MGKVPYRGHNYRSLADFFLLIGNKVLKNNIRNSEKINKRIIRLKSGIHLMKYLCRCVYVYIYIYMP